MKPDLRERGVRKEVRIVLLGEIEHRAKRLRERLPEMSDEEIAELIREDREKRR